MNKAQRDMTYVITADGLDGLVYEGKREVRALAGEVYSFRSSCPSHRKNCLPAPTTSSSTYNRQTTPVSRTTPTAASSAPASADNGKRMSGHNTSPVKPWYKQFWPWFILFLLGYSVVQGLTLLTIATEIPPGLVFDDDYDVGKGINQSLDREKLAERLQCMASWCLDNATRAAMLSLQGNSRPQQIVVNLISPTQPERDRRVILQPTADGHYRGQMVDQVSGRRFVELLGQEGSQNWRLFEEETIADGQTIMIGDDTPPTDPADAHPYSLLPLWPAGACRQSVPCRRARPDPANVLPRLPGRGRSHRRRWPWKLLPAIAAKPPPTRRHCPPQLPDELALYDRSDVQQPFVPTRGRTERNPLC